MPTIPYFDDFRRAPPGRQLIMLAGGAAAAALVLALVYFLLLRTDYEPLFGELSGAEVARITAELDAEQIAYRLTGDGRGIAVSAADVDEARLAVMNADLPLESMVGFELFNDSNIGLTEFEQKINYQRALQGELARTIMALDTVETARVHISMAEPTIFRRDRTPPTASVSITTRPGRPLPPATVEGVQRLVGAAVPDLAIADVIVLDHHGRVVSGGVVSPVLASPELRERSAIESYYAARIEGALRAFRRDAVFEIGVQTTDHSVSNLDAVPGEVRPPWETGGRDFGLIVSVVTDLADNRDEAAAIRGVVESAIGPAPGIGDAVAITPLQETARPRSPAASDATAVSVAAPQARTPDVPSGSYLVWLSFAAVAIGLAWIVARVRSAASARMPQSEREDFAAQLNDLLDEGADHAA